MAGRHRSTEEIDGLLAEFYQSGKSKHQYSREIGIGKSTTDRWIGKRRKGQRLVRVRLKEAPRQSSGGFSLALNNGRRIESGWIFDETALARLIRVAEGV